MMRTPTAALFVTCMVDQMYPEIGTAAVHLLRRAGWAVAFPPDQTCCGQPFHNSGFRPEARRLARRTIRLFEPYDAVVLPGGSCAGMIRAEYAHLFADDPAWRERAAALAAKTFELGEFLVHRTGWLPPPSTAAPEVTYHDSCHMARQLGLRDEPRRLLRAAGCRVVEMEESDRCCGFGGLFSVRMPEVSSAMTAEKLRQAHATGAPVLVTSDPGCLLQMRGAAGEGTRITHLACLLDELTR